MGSFQNWKSDMLCKRDLHAPDHRSLYAYRLDESEFEKLETLLKQRLLSYITYAPLDTIGQHVVGFPALFVLYAAEWWRRRYTGQRWSWKFILTDLGLTEKTVENWSSTQRSDCVKRGLQDWGLTLHQSNGLRYLGSIAVQGGLPVHLLAEAKGNLGRLLRSVLVQASKSKASSHDIQGWISSLDRHLPQTYRQTEIHILLADVISTVLDLKSEAKLTRNENAVVQLDQKIPDWRSHFPLPVGDGDVQRLLEQLIQDAVSTKIERQTQLFPVMRELQSGEDGQWHLHSHVSFPDNPIDEEKLAQFFAVAQPFPRVFSIDFAVSGRKLTASVRKLAGHEKYRVDQRYLWHLTDQDAQMEHRLQLVLADGQAWQVTAPRGEELNEAFPWIFDPRESSPILVHQGAGAVATNEAWVVVPCGWSAAAEDSATVSEIGELYQPRRKIFRISGTVRFTNSQNESYRVRTGRADAQELHYEWQGNRLWQSFVNPSIAFLGQPKLHCIADNGTPRAVTGELGCRILGGNSYSRQHPTGLVELYYPATGDIKHRSRMVILPTDATLRWEFLDTHTGRIHFENWEACSIEIKTPDIQADYIRQARTLILTLKISPNQRSPEWLDVAVYWSNSRIPAILRLPYPAKGGRIYSANGEEFSDLALLASNQLAGIRIHILGGDAASMLLELKGSNGKLFTQKIYPPAGSVQAEIRLQDYATEIAHLLANNDSPDAKIKLLIRIDGKVEKQLQIARYACHMERGNGQIQLDTAGIKQLQPEQLATLSVLALRLENPSDEPRALSMLESEGVARGAWAFGETEPGAWLIFPAFQAILPFRPTLWTVKGEQVSQGALAQAIGIACQTDREQALDVAIEKLADNFMDEGWHDIEKLIQQIGHLPLATLDLWRRFACSAKAMAALAMRFSNLSEDFLMRFSQELPFAWETVSFVAWKNVIEQSQAQCNACYGSAGNFIFDGHIKKRTESLGAAYPALDSLLSFALTAATNQTTKEIGLFRMLGDQWILEQLLSGGDCKWQKLLQNHADDPANNPWPETFRLRIKQARNQYPPENLFKISSDFRDSIVNLPILLAIQAAKGETSEWFENPALIHDLRDHKAFDPDWFSEAYHWTMVRCLATGLLNIGIQ